EGCWLTDEEGKRYLDASGGAMVANAGHGVAEIADALSAQARRIAYVNGTAFTTEPVEQLARELAALAPGDLDKIYFLSSGSEAVEAALKLARQYWVERGRPGKRKILSFSPGYHGNTMLALAASAREHYRRYFQPWLTDVVRVPAPYSYRCACRGEDAACPTCSGTALERAIRAEGAETIAAFIGEPIGGSSTGAATPRADYWRTIREICTRHEVLFVADEVLCGAGRTGTWSAIAQYGVTPDLMTMGKGIAAGYAPLSAVAAPERIVDVLAKGSGALMHAQTFSHHAVLCAAGLATVRYLRERQLVERAAAMGRVLHEELQALRALPAVGDVRGRGMLAGVEFVLDADTREPYPRAARFAETFADCALEAGLMVWPNVGHADGERGDLVMIAPPFVITPEEIREVVRRFERALDATLARTRSQGAA
ncbi:MAG TPA: aspartate aminotransferase family protein, partial [Gemmatimonadaceae bacterium]|nr:aspartate aminotransferase family protein [Gemmatimonadaceae bacterium]